jgi:hypothetical protein
LTAKINGFVIFLIIYGNVLAHIPVKNRILSGFSALITENIGKVVCACSVQQGGYVAKEWVNFCLLAA